MNAHDLIVAFLVTFFFVLLSVPYQFEFNYWAESPLLWAAYFIAGTILVVYIFYIFLRDWRQLIEEGGENYDRTR